MHDLWVQFDITFSNDVSKLSQISLPKIPDTLCTRHKVSPGTKYKLSPRQAVLNEARGYHMRPCDTYGKRLESHYVAVLDGHV